MEPWEGSKRYKVMVRLTPFQKPPNLNFKLLGQAGDSLGELAIIENIDTDLIVTLHQRKPDSVAAKVEVDVFYDADGIVDSQTCTVD
ncbi:MAG TPA: hypothetical protein PKD55_08205 [Bellilinea sp.]|nr:hypothetical protein [Bellilinea sp.]